MSGLADGIVIGGKVDFQRFTDTVEASGGFHNYTWNKPAGVTQVYIEVIGGGGAGGGGRGGSNNSGDDGGGAGGGAFVRGLYPAESLPTTLDVVVGSAVQGAAGASSGTALYGTVGKASRVDIPSSASTDANRIILQAFGGGGGGGSAFNDSADGGGGGGTGGQGVVGTATAGGNGGCADIQGAPPGDSLGGRGGAGSQFGRSSNLYAGNAEYGGGGGGGRANTANSAGSSIHGGGGGGGSNGSVWGSYSRGGTTGPSSDFNVGTPGISRGYGCGDGGSAGRGPHVGLNPSSPGKVGGNGGVPGGGAGGGSGAYSAVGGAGGDGARGEVRIWSW